MEEVPVYLFTGFMDGGKTSLIEETLLEDGFGEDCDRILIIACEDGEVEYDKEKLKRIHALVEEVDSKEDFTKEALVRMEEKYQPDAVFIEYNGTWEVSPLYEKGFLPPAWALVQCLTPVDGETFESYMLNMRKLMVEQIRHSDVIIFNRCDEKTKKAKFRAAVKAVNRPGQIVYERKDGTIDDRPDELPFDVSKEEIDLSDSDYALWFMDAMDNPKKYDGKIVSFLGLVYNPKEGKGKLKPGTIVPGRFAMTCCVEDVQFLGMKCKVREADSIPHKSWIRIKARVKNEFAREYRGKGPVLYPLSIEPAERPEDELVYFS